MDKYAEYSMLRYTLFVGLNYDIWSIRMNLFLYSPGVNVWQVVENGYNRRERYLIASTTERIVFECNSRAMSSILGGLAGLEFAKVMHCTFAK